MFLAVLLAVTAGGNVANAVETDVPSECQLNASSVCYGYLGCFSMASPWFTPFRPYPIPEPPDVLRTSFYLCTRAQLARYYVTKLPDISLKGSDFSGDKPTFFIAHGWTDDSNYLWVDEVKESLLWKFDANVIIVDWGNAALRINYFQSVSNIRVVAAEIIRLCKYMMSNHGASPSSFNLIGHSLGGQLASLVGKGLPGVGRIIALDPPGPGFEGYVKEVRLDISDADFVTVLRTSFYPPPLRRRPIQMLITHGHADFYFNGAVLQPGCPELPHNIYRINTNVTSFNTLVNFAYEVVRPYVNCNHQRVIAYFNETLRSSCTFWGHKGSMKKRTACTSKTCSPMGLEASLYPAKGLFHIATNSKIPFCIPDPASDNLMKKYRQG